MAIQCQYISPYDGWRCTEKATDTSGLCIFHDPNLKKDVEALKGRFEARMADEKEEPLRFDGSIFPEGISFEGVVFKREILFYRAQFCSMANRFERAEFHGERASFEEAQFRGEETSFKGAKFLSKHTSFIRAGFHCQETHFEKTEFHGEETSFIGAQFHGQKISFSRAQFRSRWTFFGWAKFYARETIFLSARFQSQGSYFLAAEFHGQQTSFIGAQFHGQGVFQGIAQNQLFLKGTANFRSISFVDRGELVFDRVDLSRAEFLYADLSKMKFLDVTWDHPHKGVLKMGAWRWSLYDERRWRQERRDKKNRAEIDRDYLPQLGRLYRALKVCYRQTGEHNLLGHFHYGQMEVQHYQKKSVSWENLYRLSSGYGEDYARAGVMLLILLLGFATVYWSLAVPEMDDGPLLGEWFRSMISGFGWGLNASKLVNAPLWKQWAYSLASGFYWGIILPLKVFGKPLFEQWADALLYSFQAATLGRVSFYEMPAGLAVRYLHLAESILVPVQFGFFILALRNRFRR